MPPSPPSPALSSLAARFAFKPAEAAKVASPNASSKRRLSTSASSPSRSSPRRDNTTTSTSTSNTLASKGKGKTADSTNASTGTRTSVELQEDGLDWEIADEDIAAIADEVLVSNSNKKIKLDNVPSSSPSIAGKTTSKTAIKSTQPGTDKVENKKVANEDQVNQNDMPSEISNETVRQFYDSLSDSQIDGKGGMLSHRQLLELESRTMDPSWLKELQKEMKKTYFLELKRFLWTEGVKTAPEISKNIFPPAGEIYSWSRFTPLDKVRVVILGQDPYHNNGQAHGLAFSVRSNVAVPPSLRNIYKEIKNDFPDFQIPKHGYLGSWARQGVLMLNTSLSVRAHQANSHSGKGWEQFTDSILKVISARAGPGVVFFAWGNPAQKRTANIITSTAKGNSLFSKNQKKNENEGSSKHLILKSVHPSPLSANRGFFGNGHFKKANEWLKEKYGEEGMIDWCTIDPEEPKA